MANLDNEIQGNSHIRTLWSCELFVKGGLGETDSVADRETR